MAAKTLEDKRDGELEMVRISMKAIDVGIEQPEVERLQWAADRLAAAIELQKKIDKRDARKAVA